MATFAPPALEERTPIRSFRDLKVWEQAFRLALDVHRLTENLPGQAPPANEAG